jgi:histidinol dehydrogenase
MKLAVIDLTKKGSPAPNFSRVALPDPLIKQAVAEIITAVRAKGDAALVRFTETFDRVKLTPSTLRVKKTAPAPEPKVQRALHYALKNIRHFSQGGLPHNRSLKNAEGARLSESYHPYARVGIYVPGGTAPLVSTALMTVGIARTAGVGEIVVMTPPLLNPELHFALTLAGATEIYTVGGAQAIAALAYGTKTIRPVQKIFGPGNAYVVEAKRQVFGPVSLDLIPGPSEIAIVADETARADFIAADLLAQAEHGKGSEILFISDSPALLAEVLREIGEQLATLSRQDYLGDVLAHQARFVLVRDIPQALSLVEDYAPEHLSLFTKKARAQAKKIRHAGAVFVGEFSPVAAGDYLAGPSHTLPTGGAGKSFSGLMVDQFFKRVSIVEYSKKAIRKAAPMIVRLADTEHLDAHAASARLRLD